MLPCFLSACLEDKYCYRENIYIYDAHNNRILYCQEGRWQEYMPTSDLESACTFICNDKDSERSNRDWCQHDCRDYVNSNY